MTPADKNTPNPQPRVPPLALDDNPPEVVELLQMTGDRARLNIFRTLVRHPRVFKRWVPFGHILLNGSLPARDRELVILRTAHRCGSTYEWSHHERIALEEGLTEAEVAGACESSEGEGWSEFEAALLRAVDELLDAHKISDTTWQTLSERYDERLLIELPMVVGHYHMLALTLNSLGVEPEDQ